jgi:MOSC domain-containing protein YiiM
LSTDVLARFNLQPGALRENVVVRYEGLHGLPSGTVLRIGSAEIRLTYHCEPCRVIGGAVDLRAIQHQRGYLGQVVRGGIVRLGDIVEELGVQFPEIPYLIPQRVRVFLESTPTRVSAGQLLNECGLSRSYARALPNLLKKLPADLREKVVFKSARF